MAENAFSEIIVPGTFIRVRADALISVGGISTGNIGIVGTAEKGQGTTHILSDYEAAVEAFGAYDAYDGGDGDLNLTRGIEILFRNGARTVYARATDAGANQATFTSQFNELIKDEINIVVAPELSTSDAKAVFGTLTSNAEDDNRDLIAVIGSDKTEVAQLTAENEVTDSGRIIMTTPGIQAFDVVAEENVDLSGTYGAAAMAGLLSSLAPQSSPTNKVLPGVVKLSQRFSYGELKTLLQNRYVVLEERSGVRVVRGLTTDDGGGFTQITTRRITDFAKAGVRKASNPFIGRLNNQRVRKALYGAIDGFLTTMVQDEALVEYDLQVTATRAQQIAGVVQVDMLLKPTFSIDFIKVTMNLQ